MIEGYSYTVINAAPDRAPRIQVAFHLDGKARIEVHGAGGDKPFLCVTHGGADVIFAPTPEPVTATDARLARDLATATAQYAAEVERVLAAQQAASPAA